MGKNTRVEYNPGTSDPHVILSRDDALALISALAFRLRVETDCTELLVEMPAGNFKRVRISVHGE